MKAIIEERPHIGGGWWWRVVPSEPGEVCPFGEYESGYCMTLWGARREVRRCVRRFTREGKRVEFEVAP